MNLVNNNIRMTRKQSEILMTLV